MYGQKHTLKKGLTRKFARFVLFRLIKKRFFNFLCVLDPKKKKKSETVAAPEKEQTTP